MNLRGGAWLSQNEAQRLHKSLLTPNIFYGIHKLVQADSM